MQNGFTRGLIIGSIIGASVSKMMDPSMMSNRTRRKMMKGGRSLLRRSGGMLGDMVDMLRGM